MKSDSTPWLQEICDAWEPKILTDDQKANHMSAALEFVTQYEKDGYEFLDGIVMGDEGSRKQVS